MKPISLGLFNWIFMRGTKAGPIETVWVQVRAGEIMAVYSEPPSHREIAVGDQVWKYVSESGQSLKNLVPEWEPIDAVSVGETTPE